MLRIRKANQRGHADHGWLNSFHTFSFADYYDPDQMGFRGLRVINEDRVKPGQGFGTHSHREMEIISYVLEGKLEHKDSIGTGAVITPGDVQRMSAGTGVSHSEFNGSKSEPVHFLQIWLMPAKAGVAPGYEQKAFAPNELSGKLRVVASPGSKDGSLALNSDATLYAGTFSAGQTGELGLAKGRHAWVQVARGKAKVNGAEVSAGDGVAISDESQIKLEGVADAELLVFDLG